MSMLAKVYAALGGALILWNGWGWARGSESILTSGHHQPPGHWRPLHVWVPPPPPPPPPPYQYRPSPPPAPYRGGSSVRTSPGGSSPTRSTWHSGSSGGK